MEVVVILHNIRSLYNVGSIFRTADAAGVKKIYLCGITPAPTDRFGLIRPQLAKVSLGAEKTVIWEKHASTLKLIDHLKKDGYKIIAAEQSRRSVPYYSLVPARRSVRIGGASGYPLVALLFGSEVRGLPQSILKKADTIVEIPMRGRKESLNVSVAFGIVVFNLLYEH